MSYRTKPGAPSCASVTAHDWRPREEPGAWTCTRCGALWVDPHAYRTPAPTYPSLADAERGIRQQEQERERCAALLRAYAETRPAGEAYALLQLCATMEAP